MERLHQKWVRTLLLPHFERCRKFFLRNRLTSVLVCKKLTPLVSNQVMLQSLPGWLSVHHKHAFPRGGAIKGAKSLHRLVESVAMRDHMVHRHLGVDHEPRNLEEFRLAEG